MAIFGVTLGRGLVVHVLKEAVVFLVGSKLERVLVVGEEGVVTISQISKGASLSKQYSVSDAMQ